MSAAAVPGATRIAVERPELFGRVAVMLGGDSSEREVSLDSGGAVLEALRERGVDAQGWDPGERDFTQFLAAGFDRVWIALHGPGGEDGRLQGALEWCAIPYTGSGVLASALAMDKLRCKRLLAAHGIGTPDWREIRGEDELPGALDALGLPLIVKPASEGSSVGMRRVDEAGALAEAWREAYRYDPRVLVERWIEGPEHTVAVLQGEALPSIRIETPRVFYDYRAKYQAEDTRYYCPGCDDRLAENRYRTLGLAAFAALGCRGWGRVDFMTGGDGTPLVLELNTVPGMTSHSLVPMAAKAAGMDFGELCWRILETSFAAQPGIAAPEVVNGA